MSKEELLKIAKEDTPQSVQIPHNWSGVIAWLLGKFGVGGIFMAMVAMLYVDLKASNERFARITEANIAVMTALVQRIDVSHSQVNEMRDTVRRIESHISNRQ
jgi:hypothetical protein